MDRAGCVDGHEPVKTRGGGIDGVTERNDTGGNDDAVEFNAIGFDVIEERGNRTGVGEV
jgi:hypothetical protein